MKVAVIGQCNNDFRNAILIYLEAKHQNYDVKLIDSFRMHNKPRVYLKVLDVENPDWLFITGAYTMSKEFILAQKAKGRKIAIWFPDSLNDERRKVIANLNGVIDILICSHYNAKEEFEHIAPTVVFMPQYWDNQFYRYDIERNFNWDVAFAGNSLRHDRRVKWLRILGRRYKLKVVGNIPGICKRTVFGTQLANIYRSSKIVIDIPWDSFVYGAFDTSDRIYKAMGCGAFYLTYDIEKLGYLFSRKTHLDTYDDTLDGLCKKLDYWLEHDDKREKIARRGQRLIVKKHTLKVRIKEYWDLMEEHTCS